MNQGWMNMLMSQLIRLNEKIDLLSNDLKKGNDSLAECNNKHCTCDKIGSNGDFPSTEKSEK